MLDPEELARVQQAVKALEEASQTSRESASRAFAALREATGPMKELEPAARRYLEGLAEGQRHVESLFPRGIPAGLLEFPPPPPAPDWKPAEAAVEKIGQRTATMDSRTDHARAELELLIAKHVTEGARNLIEASNRNTAVLATAIDTLVASSNNNTDVMSTLTRRYVWLTLVIAFAAVAGPAVSLWITWHPAAPPVVHVAAPVVNIHPAIAAPTPGSSPSPAAPRAPKR